MDLVLATGDDLVRGLWVLNHLGDSNHRLLEFTTQCKVAKACSKAAALDFRRADVNEMRIVGEGLRSRRGGEGSQVSKRTGRSLRRRSSEPKGR